MTSAPVTHVRGMSTLATALGFYSAITRHRHVTCECPSGVSTAYPRGAATDGVGYRGGNFSLRSHS